MLTSTFDEETQLVISIDYSDSIKKISEICYDFNWPHGKKTVLEQKYHLGLVKHVFFCAKLSNQYKSVILLEDDHLISPVFHNYAKKILNFYQSDDKIVGGSLYSINKNGFVNLPFFPLLDGNDVFFTKLCIVHGFFFTSAMWKRFFDWYSDKENQSIKETDNLHDFFKNMDNETEWFQIFTKYLWSQNKYLIYPRSSFCVHFQEKGTHFKKGGTWYQNPMDYLKTEFLLKTTLESKSKYDQFLELEAESLKELIPAINPINFEVDFYGTKSSQNFKSEYVLTSRSVKKFNKSFGKIMKPFELNIIENIPGKELFLAETTQINFGLLQEIKMKRSNYYYFNQGLNRRQKIKFLFIGFLIKIRLI